MATKSISKIALKTMSIRLFIVVVFVSIGGYWQNYRIIKNKTVSELEKYVTERVERESIHFDLARRNLKLAADTLLLRLDAPNPHINYDKAFEQRFMQLPNGTWQDRAMDGKRYPQMFLKRGATVTPLMKKILVITQDLEINFGFAWSSFFTNFWMAGIEDYGMAYWPSRPDALRGLPIDFSFHDYEYMTVGLPKNNPTKQPVWTGPYFDVMSKDWLISINHPFYYKGEYLLGLGMDILLNDFHDRTVKNVLQGSHNIIFRPDGRLVMHPDYINQIRNTESKLYIQDLKKDKTLQSIYEEVGKHPDITVIHDEKNKLFLAKGQIKGPGWWFVIVFPENNLQQAAMETGYFVAIMGIISLLIELLLFYQVIQTYVTTPINKLINATKLVASGDVETRVGFVSDDEIGDLGKSFDLMSEKVQERDLLLLDQTAKLEVLVTERTQELDLQRAKAFQAAKMATLGEISGGIAHEINNPLGTITLSAGALRRRIAQGETDPEKLTFYIEKIESTSTRISKIVKGLRAFSRNAEQDEMGPVPLKLIMENTLTLCEETMKRNEVALECQEVPDRIINCREVEVVQTLLNLVQNAIDAMNERENKRIKITFDEEKENLKIIVEDNGRGIPKGFVDKIMNPFFTTKEVGKGTGLGLFISCGLIESNGGKLTLEQSPGSTKFVVMLKYV